MHRVKEKRWEVNHDLAKKRKKLPLQISKYPLICKIQTDLVSPTQIAPPIRDCNASLIFRRPSFGEFSMPNLLSRTFSIVAAREHREHLALWCGVASLPNPESPCNPMHGDVRGAFRHLLDRVVLILKVQNRPAYRPTSTDGIRSIVLRTKPIM